MIRLDIVLHSNGKAFQSADSFLEALLSKLIFHPFCEHVLLFLPNEGFSEKLGERNELGGDFSHENSGKSIDSVGVFKLHFLSF